MFKPIYWVGWVAVDLCGQADPLFKKYARENVARILSPPEVRELVHSNPEVVLHELRIGARTANHPALPKYLLRRLQAAYVREAEQQILLMRLSP